MATEEEIEECIGDTKRHITAVTSIMYLMCMRLTTRALLHDISKMESPELEMFAEFGPKLKEMEYGSEEYKEALDAMGPALDHHYTHNRHHPEFFANGVNDMNLVDLIEMICDWAAASKRMKDGGDFEKSLKINAKRFNLSPQLESIIWNSRHFLMNLGESDTD